MDNEIITQLQQIILKMNDTVKSVVLEEVKQGLEIKLRVYERKVSSR